MSGRIRTIKPELLEDEKTAALDHDEWRTFVSLLLVADDYGNTRAAPDYLEGQIMWGRRPSRDFREIVARLSELSLVTLYTVRGQAYLHITNWARHQKVDKPGKPRVPGPNEADSPTFETPSRGPRETLAPDPDLRPPTNDPDQDPDPGGAREAPGVETTSTQEPSDTSDTHQVKVHYVEEFKRTRSTDPKFGGPRASWSRAMKSFAELASVHGLEQAKSIITRALDDRFTQSIQPWDLVCNANRWIGSRPNAGPTRGPPQLQGGVAEGFQTGSAFTEHDAAFG